jgi:tetratricopeptide (TPR) repeat protein
MVKFIVSFLLLITFISATAQSDKEKAVELGRDAIKVMDEGNLDLSIEMLQQARKLDPKTMDYPYEIAFAYYQKQDYKKSLEFSRPLIKHKNVTDRVFQLIGNTYDMMGDPDKSLDVYEQGIKKFPHSGALYLESGVVLRANNKIDEAVGFWERGIKADPNHSSNYYWLCKTFADSEEKIWALLYGELFMSLEYNSKRTSEISALLYKTYQKIYVATSDSTGKYDLTKKGFTITVSSKSDFKNIAKTGFLPFEGNFTMVFTTCALNFNQGIDLKSIHDARICFLKSWFEKHAANFPNVVLDFEKRMNDAGVFEAFNYWLLSQGNYEQFEHWREQNPGKFDALAKWIKENPIALEAKDKYSRLDY